MIVQPIDPEAEAVAVAAAAAAATDMMDRVAYAFP